jgi:transposase-like protein
MNFFDFLIKFPTEEACIEYFVKTRYKSKDKVVCSHCGSNQFIYHRKKGKNFDCKACGNTFSIFSDTIFKKSRTDLRKWMYAIHLFLNGKKGISALQLKREIKVTYKCAWRILHKIREAMGNEDEDDNDEEGGKMIGLTEIDEAYFGGSDENRHLDNKKGREGKKDIVLGMVNRSTEKVKAFVVENTQYLSIQKHLLDSIKGGKDNSTIITDESSIYKFFGKYFFGHRTVNHSKGEYAKISYDINDVVHTNTIEGFWATLKRGIYGVYHSVSRKYLQNYVNEFSFRYNNRKNESIFDELLGRCVLV